VHGDLKGENIMVDSAAPRAKLLDLGLARLLTKNVKALGGSFKLMAPEVILLPDLKARAPSDVFSFGRIVYMILSGEEPLGNFQLQSIVEMAKARRTMPLVFPKRMPLKQT
jgi:serine/threonine protein kinase